MAFPITLANLETAILEACAGEDEWPAQVSAGIYAGVDYAIAHPEVVQAMAFDTGSGTDTLRRYESVIGRLVGFLRPKRAARVAPARRHGRGLVAGHGRPCR